MKLIKSKTARLSTGVLNIAILGIVLLVVLFQLYAELVPEAQAAGDLLGDATKCTDAGGFFNTSQTACLNGTNPEDIGVVGFSGIPLSGLFSGTGVVFVIIMAALIVLVVKAYLPSGK